MKTLVCCMLAVALIGCDKPEPTKLESSASASTKKIELPPWYVPVPAKEKLAPLHHDIAESEGKVSTKALALLKSVRAEDGVRVAIRLEAKTPTVVKDPPQHWRDAVLDTLKVRVRLPSGEEHTLEAEPTGEKKKFRRAFRSPRLVILRLDNAGLKMAWDGERKWKQAIEGAFTTPGKHSVTIEGTLTVGEETLPFETKPVEVEVAEKNLPIAELENLTAKKVFGEERFSTVRRGRTKSNQYIDSFRTLEDSRGNRWVWLVSHLGGGSGNRTDYHVNVTPDGERIGSYTRNEFTCLAEGTELATPDGGLAIEYVRPGDALIGFDLATEREVVTKVVRVVSRPAAPVMSLHGLRLVPSHPVFAGEGFSPAATLRPGALLRHRTEGLVAFEEALPEREIAPVYDVEVEAPHNFFANDILVHNKASPVPGPADAWAFLLDRPAADGWKERKWWRRRP